MTPVIKHTLFSYLQSEKDKEVIFATNACSKVFCQLFYRGDLYVGDLPEEEDLVNGKLLHLKIIG